MRVAPPLPLTPHSNMQYRNCIFIYQAGSTAVCPKTGKFKNNGKFTKNPPIFGSCGTQALGFHRLILIHEPTLGIIKCRVTTIMTSPICVQLSMCHSATQEFRPNVHCIYILDVQRSLSFRLAPWNSIQWLVRVLTRLSRLTRDSIYITSRRPSFGRSKDVIFYKEYEKF